MNVTKCDACGKEIDTERSWCYGLREYSRTKLSYYDYDLCSECLNKFHRFVNREGIPIEVRRKDNND